MPAPTTGAAQRTARSRLLTPADDPRRRDYAAAAGLVLLLGHLLFAQVTVVLAVVFTATSRLTRWRPLWLAVPAAAGLTWACAIGPVRAAAGFAAGPAQVTGYLAGSFGHPGELLHLSRAYAGLGSWLPRQLPLALIAGAAEAGLAFWIRRYRTGEPDRYRPGLVVAARRRAAAAALAAGDTLTATGAGLGLDPATGRRAEVSWAEAQRGVLITGSAPDALVQTGLALAVAAVRRRKAVVVIDLAGRPQTGAALAAACAAAGAPLRRFGPAGPGCYEPVRGGHPERAAALALAMIDWSEVSDAGRRTCTACLTDACAVLAAAPAAPGRPGLDDIAALLQPDALRARAAGIPGFHARRPVLADRAEVSAALLEQDPAAAAVAVQQLTRLRRSALGCWLRPAAPGPGPGGVEPDLPISLGQALRDRAVLSFALDQAVHGRSARMIAALALADLIDVLAELQAMAVRTDCLAWITGCEALPAGRLAELVRLGAQTGAAIVLSATSAPAAVDLAGVARVIAVRGAAEPQLAAALASGTPSDGAAQPGPVQTGLAQAGPRQVGPALTRPGAGPAAWGGPASARPAAFWPEDSGQAMAAALAAADPDVLTLLVRGPGGRLLHGCQAVPAGLGTGR
ncbi:MAG: hypothetical protein ACLP7J_29725 [Streptosporangiaceae bacterium]